MKKLFSTVSSLFFLSFVSHLALAQVTPAEDTEITETQRNKQGSFHFGVTTAINNTWIFSENEEQNNKHYENITTYKQAPIGLAIGYKFSYRNDLQVEAYISHQGQNFKLKAQGNGTGDKIGEKHINLTYLQVPLLWKFTTGDATRFNLHFGPQIGFLIKGEEINVITQAGGIKKDGSPIPTGTAVLAHKNKGEDLTKNIGGLNNLDPNLALGFGLEKDITDHLYLTGNLRFHYGFKDFRDAETVIDDTTGDKYILRYNIYGGVQFGIHYTFNRPWLKLKI